MKVRIHQSKTYNITFSEEEMGLLIMVCQAVSGIEEPAYKLHGTEVKQLLRDIIAVLKCEVSDANRT